MDNAYIDEQINQAQMILLGLGEEFDEREFLRKSPQYINGCELLKRDDFHWLIPAWGEFCSGKSGECRLRTVLEKLRIFLKDKNYFVVSVSTNSHIALNSWKDSRLVMPCGTILKKQCANGCQDILSGVTEADREMIQKTFDKLWEGFSLERGKALFGACPECGAPLILNNVYAENYNERGYLEQWQIYTKWLQGTLNRKLLVLELGVGMDFPSVIRWPFEKAAYFNQKAYFCRVNAKLYQLTEELVGKGCGISQNAIDWLEQLC